MGLFRLRGLIRLFGPFQQCISDRLQLIGINVDSFQFEWYLVWQATRIKLYLQSHLELRSGPGCP